MTLLLKLIVEKNLSEQVILGGKLLENSKLLFDSYLKKKCVLNNSYIPDFVRGIGGANKVDSKNYCLHEASILVGVVRQ